MAIKTEELPWTERMRTPAECARRYVKDRAEITEWAKKAAQTGFGPRGLRLRVRVEEAGRGGNDNFFLNPVDADAIWFGGPR